MNPLARFSFPKLPAAPKGGTIPLKGANRTMDKILNLLSLTPGEKEAFLAAAPGLSQRFAASIPLDTADYAGTEVILGNPPPAALRHAPALR